MPLENKYSYEGDSSKIENEMVSLKASSIPEQSSSTIDLEKNGRGERI
jgi:hypothetical protein